MGGPGKPKIDLRAEPRVRDAVRLAIFVVYGRDYRPSHEAAHDITIDISEGGLSFYDEWGLPEHVLLEIRLQTAANAPTIVQYGRVRWRRPAPDTHGFTVGVQFVEATRADREAWVSHVRARHDTAHHGIIHFGGRPGEG